MHIFFPVAGRRGGPAQAVTEPVTDPGQIFIIRDPDDESEWQYLGNPEIAARTSLKDVVDRFLQDCRAPDGSLDNEHIAAAKMVRNALLSAAGQIDDALAAPRRA